MSAVRPRTIAEIFDRAVTLVVHRWSAGATIALIASIPATLSQALRLVDPRALRHVPILVLGLQLLSAGALAYGFAALAQLYAGTEEQPSALGLFTAAFGSFWRLLRVALACAFVAGLVVALAIFAGSIGRGIGGPAGWGLTASAVLLLGSPIVFVAQLALANAVLEGMGALDALDSAFARALLFGTGWRRTYLLAMAVLMAYLAPRAIVTATLAAVAVLTRQAWLMLLAPAFVTLLAFVFVSAVVTVAALDYRLRAEGDDLEAALDAPAAAT